MQLAKKSETLPPAYWLLTCISGSLTIHAARDILKRHGGRGLALALGFFALSHRKQAMQIISAAQRELKPDALALRKPGSQQTSKKLLEDMYGRAFAACMPLYFAARKVPLPAVAAMSVLTVQTATAFNSVFEAALTELLTTPSPPMRLALALAVVPGWVATLYYRNMGPIGSSGTFARSSTSIALLKRATPAGDASAEDHGVIETAVEDVSHWLTEMAVDARCLPPAFWMAVTASGAITLQAVSVAATSTLRG
jgi:hypothetical protein